MLRYKVSSLIRFTGIDHTQIPLINRGRAYIGLLIVGAALREAGLNDGEILFTDTKRNPAKVLCSTACSGLDEAETAERFARTVDVEYFGAVLRAAGRNTAEGVQIDLGSFHDDFVTPMLPLLRAEGVDPLA